MRTASLRAHRFDSQDSASRKRKFGAGFWAFNASGSEVKLLSSFWLFATPWTAAHQAPPSMGFSRQEYWSGLPFPFPGDLPDPGIEPRSPALQSLYHLSYREMKKSRQRSKSEERVPAQENFPLNEVESSGFHLCQEEAFDCCFLKMHKGFLVCFALRNGHISQAATSQVLCQESR